MSAETETADLVATHTLPDPAWTDDFERIFLPARTKTELVEYGRLVQQLADQGIDRETIQLHGLVLLHGPPGTGKTTVAKGAANELARRAGTELAFRHVRIDQLAGSKLGQTPKLVGQVFEEIRTVADRGARLVLLLDEVESLFVDRSELSGDADPYDSTRAVNTALNEIDALADYAQVYTIATSNQRGAIDRAFADRADTEIHVELPKERFRAFILADAFAHWNDALGTELPTDRAALADFIALTEGFSGRQIWKAVQGVFIPDGNGAQLTDVTLADVHRAVIRKREALEAADHVPALDAETREALGLTDHDGAAGRDDEAPEPFRFRYATQAQANAVRDMIPAVFCTNQYGSRHKAIELYPETPTKWVETAAEAATGTPVNDDGMADSCTVGQFLPRIVGVDPHQSTGGLDLLEDIESLTTDLLAQADHGNPEAVRTVLGDERVTDAIFELVALEALTTVRVATDGFTLDIDVQFGDAPTFLEPPPAAIVPELDEEAPISITMAADAAGTQAIERCPTLRAGPATITVTNGSVEDLG
jgi:MoxR-like ATPase